MERVIAQNLDLDARVAQWRADHPSGTLQEAVGDLKLWPRTGDPDAQRLVWYALRRIDDPAALEGFPAMRTTARAAR